MIRASRHTTPSMVLRAEYFSAEVHREIGLGVASRATVIPKLDELVAGWRDDIRRLRPPPASRTFGSADATGHARAKMGHP